MIIPHVLKNIDSFVYGANTIVVPYSLTTNIDNFVINTIQKPSNSNQELLRLALKYHQGGKLSHAEKYYQMLLDNGFLDSKVLSNYASILFNNNQKDQAIDLYTKAIKLTPKHPIPYINLASLLRGLGRFRQAERLLREAIHLGVSSPKIFLDLGVILKELGNLPEAKNNLLLAIKIKPDCGLSYSHLGIISRLEGDLVKAEEYLRLAIKIIPDCSFSLSNLALILKERGQISDAFNLLTKATKITPNNDYLYSLITRFLRDVNLSLLNKKTLRDLITMLLDRKDFQHQSLFKPINFLYKNILCNIYVNLSSRIYIRNVIKSLVDDSLLNKALKSIIFVDQKWEILFTKLRKYFLVSNDQDINSAFKLLVSLSHQSFLSEFIYDIDNEEQLLITSYLKRIQNKEINIYMILKLACYIPLYKFLLNLEDLNFSYQSDPDLLGLFKQQFFEPIEECEFSHTFKKVGNINNIISIKVRTQYEKNPYPRWIYSDPYKGRQIQAYRVINSEIKPNTVSDTPDLQAPNILIAGCGTGQQVLLAQRYLNAQITAIDLSTASLSYSKRKFKEYDIKNVEMIHMDILDIALLNKKFDIIECSGVLHHMENPHKAIKILIETLKDRGLINLGLYSQFARKNIIKARDYIFKQKYSSSDNDIRKFRKYIFSTEDECLKSLTNASDFYSLSSCRDLCFHEKEHRFNIPDLQVMLSSNNLKFHGFCLPNLSKSLYQSHFPEDIDQVDLNNWYKFENMYPNTFVHMYQFWASKLLNEKI